MAIENAYRSIAQEVVRLCPSPFKRAVLHAKLEEDVTTLRLERVGEGEAVARPRIGGSAASDIDDALTNLRDEMMTSGQAPWSSCTFTLTPHGKFKLDVAYDD